MKKLYALLAVFALCLLPHLASAGEGKEGFFFMFLLGAGGALFLLVAFVATLLLSANLTRSRTAMTILSTAGALGWVGGTYWCFDFLLNPVFWFMNGGMWSANYRTDWHPDLTPWFVADAGCAALIAALAWRQWYRRRLKLQYQAELEASLHWPFPPAP